MNYHAALEFLESGEYMAMRDARPDVMITREVTSGKLFRLLNSGRLRMDRVAQPWVDTGEPWTPTHDDLNADDWVVTTLPSP